ncbi:thiol:disulfide interchange protein DsbA/DsbL [Vibrio sp. 10N.239.312.D08]|uniref:thiol:disulfide interchange protein DsbA/DsbL n=1 Tax=Vibrio sp. 10N.239.312.D08 TaxID=3229978 RepID=UPI00355425A7
MKKLFAFVTSLLLSVSAHAQSSDGFAFDQGQHYKDLGMPKTNQKVVTEYFSFYCGHCYSFEPIIAQLKQRLPQDVTLVKKPVSFMGGNMAIELSKAYVTAKELGVEDKIVASLFETIHNKRQAPKNVHQLSQLFVSHGVSENEFETVFSSSETLKKANLFDKDFYATKLTGVPSVVVNGKYLANAGGVKSIGEYVALIEYLLTK